MSERLLADRYRLESVLGRGGMATVWRALDTRLGRAVAVKVLQASALIDPAAQQRFNREAWTVARLRDPHIVTVFDAGLEGERPFLVMELVEGTTLAALLAAGRLDVDRAVDVAMQVCDALSAAHAAGLVHRDVKPGNILIGAGGVVKVCDFGIVRIAGAGQATLTVAGTAVGTSRYMAPEQVSGGPVDARTDMYGLGCVLYTMLTGASPFEGDAPLSIVWQHLHREPDPIIGHRPDLPPPLVDLIGALLAKNPDDRPQTAAEVRAALAGVADAGSPAAALAGTGTTIRASAAVVSPTRTMPAIEPIDDGDAPSPRSRWWVPAGVGAVAGATLVAIVVAFLASGPSETASPPAAGAPATTADTPSAPSVTDAETPSDPIAAIRQVIAAQRAAGQIDADAADKIDGKLDDLQPASNEGKKGKLNGRSRDLTRTLEKLHEEGKITDAGWDAIGPAMAMLTHGTDDD
jgi:serine/threonine-protein kinase